MAGAAEAECVYPKEPANMPDGATATQEQMVEGMKAVKEYNGQVTAYLSCLEQEMNARVEAAGPDAPAEQIEQIKAIHTKRHNAAVEALEAARRPLQRAGQDLQGPRQEELTRPGQAADSLCESRRARSELGPLESVSSPRAARR